MPCWIKSCHGSGMPFFRPTVQFGSPTKEISAEIMAHQLDEEGVCGRPWFGMWGDTVDGHILSTTDHGQIIDTDPTSNGGPDCA